MSSNFEKGVSLIFINTVGTFLSPDAVVSTCFAMNVVEFEKKMSRFSFLCLADKKMILDYFHLLMKVLRLFSCTYCNQSLSSLTLIIGVKQSSVQFVVLTLLCEILIV